MEWSKIKNIVLLILVCVNAFLLALVLLQQHKTARFQEEASAGAVSALANSGIAFHLERVPRDMELAGLNFTQDRSGEQAAAEALLGRVTEQAESTTMRTLYAGANGSAEFFMSGEFSVALDAGVYQADPDELERAGRDCLALLGMEAELVSRETREQESVWTYRQLWEDVPVFSCQVELTWRDGSLVLLRGRRLAGSALPADTGAPLTTATVLVRFLAGLNEGNYV